jgi:Ca2+-transporting ATPase
MSTGIGNHVYKGLTDKEVIEQRREYGENVLPKAKPVSPISILVSQFKSPLIYVILGAAVVSILMGERKDFAIIMAVVVFDVILGFFQEYQANATYESLKALVKPVATVMRNGERTEVEAHELVPGDVVLLDTGDKISADGNLLEAKSLSLNEAILTGESEPVVKRDSEPVYMGTTAVAGRGVMEVTATGKNTKLGEIAHSITQADDQETPLQKRLAIFSGTLTKLVIAITGVMYIIGVLNGKHPLDMVRVAIVLAVAAIPEGLLIAVTVILVIGMKKVLKRQGLVKQLLAVETLGSVTVICTDKTGTLTEGQMTATHWEMSDQDMAFKIMALNNNLSDALEVAIWDLAKRERLADLDRWLEEYPRLDEEPFSSEKKYMRTLHSFSDNNGGGTKHVVLLKGAPEIVLEKCKVDENSATDYRRMLDEWADEGLRLLGLAYKEILPEDISQKGVSTDIEPEQVLKSPGSQSGFIFAGLVGLQDPVRAEVPEAIETCHRAGIQVKMITGDHRKTALRVAKIIGLDADPSQVLEGKELDAMDDEELKRRVEEIMVFSRILPHQKLRIVSALQSLGEVVAMVGDGVNDAPALKKADIGVVVGTASDVAKETADLVLLDSNFKTIVAAVEEGRVVFQNIKKVVSYTLSNSFAEILLVFVSMLLGWPAPLTVAQILWIHLICDGPVDIVLGFEPKEEGIMEEKPRPVTEPILDRLGMGLIASISGTAALGCLLMFNHYMNQHGDLALARTITFETLAVISLVYVFAYRSMRKSIFHSGHLTENKPLLVSVAFGFVVALAGVLVPYFRTVLGVVPLEPQHWVFVFGLSFLLLLIVESGKHLALSRGGGRK